ncbi:MAG: preprotein translocase subunit SecE [Solirubrobacteraceae bacterium]
MARDRKRAKQRRQRGAGAAVRPGGSSVPESAQATTPSQPVRADLPGSLDHAAAEVDEFDAALVRGAGGVPLEEDLDAGTEDQLQERPAPGGPSGGRGAGSGGGGGGGGENGSGGTSSSGAPIRGGNRAVGFLGASWAELQRVQWPDRRQVTQATAVVIGFVAIAGAYLGLADYVAKEIVEFIL